MSIFTKILEKIFGTSSDRYIKKIVPILEQIEPFEEELRGISDEDLQAKSDELKDKITAYTEDVVKQLEEVQEDLNSELGEEARERAEDLKEDLESKLHQANQEILREILPEAFAVVKEVCYRLTAKEFDVVGQKFVWGDDVTDTYSPDDFEWEERTPPGYDKRMVAELPEKNAHDLTNSFTLVQFSDGRIFRAIIPFRVQIVGGIVLHQGNIAEMATGEGKTLAAVFPVYLNALTGRGVHVITVNDYLAQRDAAWMGQIYNFLGLSVGCVHGGIEPHSPEREEQYRCDITYGTNNEFGFDYLRDNMARHPQQQVQRGHHFAIVDEVDSVLIDEARTPLIISGPVKSKIHEYFAKYEPLVSSMVRRQLTQSTRFLNEAERELKQAGFFDDDKEQDKDKIFEAAEKLLKVQYSTPKLSKFMKLVKEPGVAKLLHSVESDKMLEEERMSKMSMRKQTGKKKLESDLFVVIDEKNNTVELTDKGLEALDPKNPERFDMPERPDILEEQIDADESLSLEEKIEAKKEAERNYLERMDSNHAVNQLLKAHLLFAKDVDYVVVDGKVVIVDSFTGRLMPGRRFSEGLHQALEAKENVHVQNETQTMATITLQNYFRMYDKLSGMTGTAETEANEFWEIYKLDVVVIPTNRPVRRDDNDDQIYMTRREKFNAVLDEIEYWNERQRPVLVGTVSVEVSETLSRMLKRRKISHSVLNAKHHRKEAEIVAGAGRPGAVTIATNMAGRGTDIKLGTNVVRCSEGCHLLSKEPDDTPVAAGEWTLAKCREDVPCGLHIIGTERHESRRIDRQLRGRSGRQGDPGSSRFYLSLEDDLMRLFGSERIAAIMDRVGAEEGESIGHPIVTKSIQRAQKRVESQNFAIRKHLLEYDDVNNTQREIIYKRRQRILDGGNLKDEYHSMIKELCEHLTNKYADRTVPPEGWDWDSLKMDFSRSFLYTFEPEAGSLHKFKPDELLEKLVDTAFEAYDHREKLLGSEVMRELERYVLLMTIDEKWKDHLYALDSLKGGINLRAYAQKDPLVEYKREGFELFSLMLNDVNETALQRLFRAQVVPKSVSASDSGANYSEVHKSKGSYGVSDMAKAPSNKGGGAMPQRKIPAKRKPIIKGEKVGRNDPCPCGSGKKYKNCCGKL